MKVLRLALAALALLAACDTLDPVAPPPAPRFDGGVNITESCDTVCARSPFMGGTGG